MSYDIISLDFVVSRFEYFILGVNIISFYSSEVIEQVRNLNEIVKVISSYLPLKQKGNNYFGLCPFHNEKSASFAVNTERQIYHCFGCGASGNVFTFVMQMENYSFTEAIKFLADRANYSLPDSQDNEFNQKLAHKNKLIKINTDAAQHFYHILVKSKLALGYLLSRGITKNSIKKFGLGYDDNSLYDYLVKTGYTQKDIFESGLVIKANDNKIFDRFSGRVIFPIFDIYKKIIGFGGRTLSQNSKPKYLNSAESVLFNKSASLYNINLACKSKLKELILTEGYMDTISVYQTGLENVCASLGTAFNIKHARLIKDHFDSVILLFDSDEPGVKAALRAISILNSVNLETKVLLLKDAKDPNEYINKFGSDNFRNLVKSSLIDSTEFEIGCARKKYNLDVLSDKVKFTREAAQIILKLNDRIKQEIYIRAISKSLQISEETLLNEIRDKKAHYEPETISIGSKKVCSNSLIDKAKSDIINIVVRNPKVYKQVKKYLSPDELGSGAYKRLLEMIYFMLDENGFMSVNTAELVDYFETPVEQSLVANILSQNVSYDDLQKALTDIIKIIKRHNLSQKISSSSNINELAVLIQEKKMIDMINIVI